MIHRERLAIYTIPAVFLFAGFATIGRAGDAEGDWSQFRGPQGNGVAAQAHPTRWSDKQNLAWRVEA
jgi:hypothetical protein